MLKLNHCILYRSVQLKNTEYTEENRFVNYNYGIHCSPFHDYSLIVYRDLKVQINDLIKENGKQQRENR